MDADAAVRQFYEAMNTGQTALLDDVLADDWEEIPRSPGQGAGREGMKPVIGWLRSLMPDFHISEEDLFVAGDRVAVRSTTRGTPEGEMLGLSTSGRPIEFSAFDFHRVQDGKIAQTWHVEDFLSVVHQLGGRIVAAD